MSLTVGEPAPDFVLEGVDGMTGESATYRLSEFSGSPLVVVFYPQDDSAVCTKQLESYTSGIGAFRDVGAAVVAISPQDIDSHRRFAAAHGGFAFPLLADPDRAVGRAYGILGLRDLYRRSTFVLDADGEILYTHRFVGPGLSFKPIDQLVGAVKAAG